MDTSLTGSASVNINFFSTVRCGTLSSLSPSAIRTRMLLKHTARVTLSVTQRHLIQTLIVVRQEAARSTTVAMVTPATRQPASVAQG